MSEMFDGTNCAMPTKFKKLTNGWYNTIITNAEKKISKSNVYQMVMVEYKVTDPGEFKGRLQSEHFCLQVNDAGLVMDKEKTNMALTIGRGNFANVLKLATGSVTIAMDDLDNLIGSRIKIRVESMPEDKYTSIKERDMVETLQPNIPNMAPPQEAGDPGFSQDEQPF